MEIKVTRRHRGLSSNNNNALKRATTIVNNYTQASPQQTMTAPTFEICLNFLELLTCYYLALDDMIVKEVFCQNGTVTLSRDIDTLIGQYEILEVTPTELGRVVLKGEFKL